MLERPELWGGLVDVDEGPGVAARLAAHLLADDGEDQAALRGDRRLGLRVRPGTPPTTTPARIDGAGVYVVTGGLGGVGSTIARWLAERGARRVALIGRGAPGPGAAAAIAAMRAAGAEVSTHALDVADAAALTATLAALRREGPLRGVVHAAGTLDDGLLVGQDLARMAGVAAAKLPGAWNLHVATADDPLECFVLCSSAAALTGSAGQGTYAAANAFLDALAEVRRAAGRPGLSVQWGAWAEVGRAAGGSRDEAWWRERGVRPISPGDGLAALGRLLADGRPRVAVFPVDGGRFLAPFGAAVPRALAGLGRAEAPAAPAGELLARLAATPPARALATVQALVRERVAAALHAGAGEPPPLDVGLSQLGFDSLMALDLRRRLQADVGRPLPATLVFDHPTIAALTRYLGGEVLGLAAPPPTPEVDADAARVAAMSEDELGAAIDDRLAALLGEDGV
jgi:myxalamid-type polyketide synthase MxaE and MxaD/epothilone polyketide synthase C/epothilone polyketide synthase D